MIEVQISRLFITTFKTWVKLIRYTPDFEFVFLLTAFVPVDLPTLTTQFRTFVRYFAHILFSILPHSLWYLTSFCTFLCRYWPVLLCCYTPSSLNVFLTLWKISLSEAYPLPDFEFVFLLTAFVPVDLPTLTTQFYTLLVRYFSHILFSILPYTFTLFNRFPM